MAESFDTGTHKILTKCLASVLLMAYFLTEAGAHKD